ncbi:MAG: putrescine ABC transporter permease PotI, partial [Plesiomonas shigelloides]
MSSMPAQKGYWKALILFIGLSFLYVPMIMLVVYSFNSSRLVTVWAGWSTIWYRELFADQAMMDAVWLSLTIATAAASAAVVLGTMASFVMTRFRRFRGQTSFA